MSFLVVIKVCTELLTFHNKEEEEEPTTCCQRFRKTLKDKVHLVKTFCSLFPFLFTSGVFNIGTISLAIVVLHFDAFYFLGIAFLINLTIFLLVPCLLRFACVRKHLNQDEPSPAEKDPFLVSVLLSWTNLFILSCSLVKSRVQKETSLLYVQVARVVTNTILLLYLFSVHGFKSEFPLVAIISSLLITVGVLFFVLIWKSSLLRKADVSNTELGERAVPQDDQSQEETSKDQSSNLETQFTGETQVNESQTEDIAP